MSTDKRENMTFVERKKEFELQIQNAETIAISGHMNPDGDCIGSCLGHRHRIRSSSDITACY